MTAEGFAAFIRADYEQHERGGQARRHQAEMSGALPAGRLRLPLPRLRAGGAVSLCGAAQLHARRRAARGLSRAARPARLRARRAGAAERLWPRQCGDARRARARAETPARRRRRRRGTDAGDPERNGIRLGVRGLRANEFRRDGKPYYQNGVRLADIEPLYPAMAELGWHLQLWIDARDLPELQPRRSRAYRRRCRSWSITWAAWITATASIIPDSRRWCAAWAKAGYGPRCRAPTGSGPPRRIISRQSPSTTRWSPPIRPISSGARTGRIRGRRAGAGREASAAICSSTGRRAQQDRQAILSANPARLYDFR